jgi:hypothetical protein
MISHPRAPDVRVVFRGLFAVFVGLATVHSAALARCRPAAAAVVGGAAVRAIDRASLACSRLAGRLPFARFFGGIRAVDDRS